MESLFGEVQVAVSDSGSIAYVPGSDRSVGRLGWVDRTGTTELLHVPERVYGVVELSPDGTRLAVPVADVMDYVWIYDLGRNEGRKLTAGGPAGWPIWSPDGQSVVVERFGSAEPGLYRLPVGDRGGVTAERLWNSKPSLNAYSFAPDGRSLAVGDFEGQARVGLLSTLPGSQVEWFPISGNAWGPSFSPDGRYVAYASDETGQYEIWVRPVSGASAATQISVDGGIEPLWSRNGLFYRKGHRWFSAKVTALEPKPIWEPPKVAFETDFVDTPGRSYAVSPDGQRLLVVKRTREPIRSKVVFVQNWFEDVRRLAPKP